MTVRNSPGRRTGFWAGLFSLFGGARREAEYLPPPPPPTWRERTPDYDAEVALPLKSRDDFLEFTARVRLIIRTDGNVAPETNTVHIGMVGVTRRAQQIAERYSLLETDRLCTELNVALSQLAQVNGTGVASKAVCLSVEANPQDTEILRRYRDAMRIRHLASLDAVVKRNEIAYFNELLSDPQQATAWWFHQNSANVEQLPAVAETFKTITGRLREPVDATGTFEAEPETADDRGTIFQEFLVSEDAATVALVDRYVANLFKDHDRLELLERWRDLSKPEGESMFEPDAHDS